MSGFGSAHHEITHYEIEAARENVDFLTKVTEGINETDALSSNSNLSEPLLTQGLIQPQENAPELTDGLQNHQTPSEPQGLYFPFPTAGLYTPETVSGLADEEMPHRVTEGYYTSHHRTGRKPVGTTSGFESVRPMTSSGLGGSVLRPNRTAAVFDSPQTPRTTSACGCVECREKQAKKNRGY